MDEVLTPKDGRGTAGEPEPISWFPVTPETELEPPERALFAKVRERTGAVPNVFRAYAWRPERLRAWFAHFREVMRPTPGLGAREREMISVAVSMTNGCLYCLVAHGAALRELSDDPVIADRLTLDYRRVALPERERAMLDYAVKLTRDPVHCDAADLERLRQLGFSREEVWDIIEVTAMFNFTNRLAMGSGMLPNREDHARCRERRDGV
ncbi:MAG TPA: peroxidase-related enzyme [Candidatus Dormibacteraeota bacterium]|nr:peroxidase-related enzyme [Candidatus Dormibacteraeota bacterium]